MKATIGVVLLAVLLLGVFSIARLAWRFYRGEVEMEPGGSMGRQMFGRDRDDETPDDQP